MAHESANIPHGVTVCVRYDDTRHPSRFVTCFRCGEYGHYRSECHTFKTRLCVRFGDGECPLSSHACPMAHGIHELRQPWRPRCVRIVKIDGCMQTIGCGEFGHTFRACPNSGRAVDQPQSVGTVHSVSDSNVTL